MHTNLKEYLYKVPSTRSDHKVFIRSRKLKEDRQYNG